MTRTQLRRAASLRALVGGCMLAGVAALGGIPAPSSAQEIHDIEVVAAARGIQLPASFYDRLRDDPNAFEIPGGWGGRRAASILGGAPGASVAPVSGQFNLLVIPALFRDSDEPLFSSAEIQGALFDGPSGTLRDFYLEASGNQLDVRGTVAPWVRTTLDIGAVVGGSFGLGGDARVGEYLVEALRLSESSVDFSALDNDGPDGEPNSGDDDGFVDALVFEFQEIAASCGGPSIWPHRSSISGWLGAPYETNDVSASGGPIMVNGYIIQGTTDCAGVALQSANVITHEFGHVLGLPDLYHAIDGIEPQNRRWILGCWALMAGGSWGCGDASAASANNFGPTQMSPWSRDQLGWTDWIEVGDVVDQEFVLPSAARTRTALRISLDTLAREWVVIEYRDQVGFDDFLPASGVLVYHWDDVGGFRPPAGSPLQYRITLKEADGRTDMRSTFTRGGNRGEAGDAWGIGGRFGPINNGTVPSTRRHVLDSPSTLVIHSILVEGGTARVRLTHSPTPSILAGTEIPEATRLNPFSARIPVHGGAPPYQASVVTDELPARGLSAAGDGDHVVLTGAPDNEGTFEVDVRIEDFYGRLGTVRLAITVGPFFVPPERLVQPFILNGAVPLTEAEKGALDELGNGDGVFDIGDARAFLMGGI